MPHLDTQVDIDSLALLKFKDFVPQRKAPRTWKSRGEFEPLSFALQEANAWILHHPDIELLNVETVVLPNVHDKREEGSEDPDFQIIGGASINWNQFFRIWYIERKAS